MTDRRLRPLVRWGAFLVLVVGAMLWAGGAFEGAKIVPGRAPEAPGLPAPAAQATAVRAVVPVFEEAVGTVQSRRRVVVAAQVTGRVLAIAAEVGDGVSAGAVLLQLEDRELAARFARAKSHHERVQGFLARGAATPAEMEAAEAEYLQAKAELEHATIRAPIDGVVAERNVEPGDLAWSGRPLLVVLDPDALRLEAQVREGLIAQVSRGASLPVALPAAAQTVEGTVAEILPSADPESRTFTVRVNLESVGGVHPGMFGRLRLPRGSREVVRVP
jgi:HlyD family secretion protein